MINKILFVTMVASGIAHNVHDIPGAFWVFEACFICLLWHNRIEIIQRLSE